ncbi:hypothetical protein PAXINDRAFT_153995 [Paxillus involutus ATCC 200175]|nr:hypothetical protein PAXINDRAFT_153995 [Paxillus involutus ATCC 200175]
MSVLEYTGPSAFYKELAEVPIPISADFVQISSTATVVIRVTYAIGDLERKTSRLDASDTQAFAVSPSRKHQATLREIENANGNKRFVEIWADLQLVASLDVTQVHGQFYTDGNNSSNHRTFGIIHTPTTGLNAILENHTPTDDTPLFVLRWGSPVDAPSITRVPKQDISLRVLALPKSLSDTVSLGQAVFVTEERIFATGYETGEDRRFLGIKWSPGRSFRSPRVFFDLDGEAKQLFWLSHPVGESSSSSLHVRDLVGGTGDRILIDSVSGPGEDQFPGLYTNFNLLANPFIHNMTQSVVLQTCWRSSATIISVHVETEDINHERMWFGGSPSEGWTVLATDGVSQMVCSKSSITSPPKLVLLTLNRGGESMVSPKMEEALGNLALSVIPIPDRHPVDSIVLQSKRALNAAGPRPYCVTMPHGGPYGVSTTNFAPAVTALALEGCFGDKYIDKLTGRVGTLDVSDCMATVEELVRLGISEHGRQLVHGSSHGGFIAGHLIGQYPDVFKAAVMVNAVTSLGEFVASSDEPDFPFVEMGIPYPPGTCMTPEIYQVFYEDDRRVPPTQGKNYFHALKGRGRQVDMLTFPEEAHAIEGVEAGRDWFRMNQFEADVQSNPATMSSESSLAISLARGPFMGTSIGLFSVDGSLYGVICLQAFFYFQTYVHDRRALKIIVATLLLFETVHATLSIWVMDEYLVAQYGNQVALEGATWLSAVSMILSQYRGVDLDSLWFQATYIIGVAILLLSETVHAALSIWVMDEYLVAQYGNQVALEGATWGVDLDSLWFQATYIIGFLIDYFVYLYFTWRIWICIMRRFVGSLPSLTSASFSAVDPTWTHLMINRFLIFVIATGALTSLNLRKVNARAYNGVASPQDQGIDLPTLRFTSPPDLSAMSEESGRQTEIGAAQSIVESWYTAQDSWTLSSRVPV